MHKRNLKLNSEVKPENRISRRGAEVGRVKTEPLSLFEFVFLSARAWTVFPA
jgi:hypothetical protein